MVTIHLLVDAVGKPIGKPIGKAYASEAAANRECIRRNQLIRDRYPDFKGNAMHVIPITFDPETQEAA